MKRLHLIRTIARAALFALLFAQGALAANACLRVGVSLQTAFDTAPMEGCDMGAANPNVCLYQYLDQNDQYTAQTSVLVAATQFVAPPAVTQPRLARDIRARLPPPGCAPPIPIRYCSLLI